MGNNLSLRLAYEMGEKEIGTVCETEILHSLQVDSVRIELNFKTPKWYHRESLIVRENSYIFGDQKCQK